MGEELGEIVVGGERHRAGERLKQHTAKRVDVGARVDGIAAGLLGRNVVDRPDERPGARQPVAAHNVPGEAEVRQVHVLSAAA